MNQNLIFSEYAGRGITLQTDDKDMHCQVFCVFRTDENSEQKYIALLEVLENDVNSHLLIYRFNINENGAPDLSNIESEDEYKKVTDVLNDYMNYLDELEVKEHQSDGCGCGCSSCGGGCH